MPRLTNAKIPMWINVVQGLLTAIMLQQTYMFYFDYASVAASGITAGGTGPNLNLLYEFAGRTATMAIASLFALATQNPRYFLVVLLMNLLREGQETIIDPLFPLSNAPISPTADLVVHLVILAIELWAFLLILKVVRQEGRVSASDAA